MGALQSFQRRRRLLFRSKKVGNSENGNGIDGPGESFRLDTFGEPQNTNKKKKRPWMVQVISSDAVRAQDEVPKNGRRLDVHLMALCFRVIRYLCIAGILPWEFQDYSNQIHVTQPTFAWHFWHCLLRFKLFSMIFAAVEPVLRNSQAFDEESPRTFLVILVTLSVFFIYAEYCVYAFGDPHTHSVLFNELTKQMTQGEKSNSKTSRFYINLTISKREGKLLFERFILFGFEYLKISQSCSETTFRVTFKMFFLCFMFNF
jgi:hypothetical protein